MTFKGYRLHIIVLACALIVTIGLGARHIAYGQRVIGPLERDFAALNGVIEARVEQRGEHTDIILTLGAVDDLEKFYSEAEMLRDERLASARLVLKDDRTDSLIDAYEQMHFAVYEGAFTGRFTHMAATVDEIARTLPVDGVKVSVDDRFIYVQVAAGDASLYEVVPLSGRLVGDPQKGDGGR